jgi:hypothetical protein
MEIAGQSQKGNKAIDSLGEVGTWLLNCEWSRLPGDLVLRQKGQVREATRERTVVLGLPSARQARTSGFPKDSVSTCVGPGSRLRVCAGTLSLVQGETVLHEFPMARPANDLPAESGTPSARFCPSPSARRSGLARLDEDNLSPPSRSNCSVARAAASGPAVPVSLTGCACQPVTREDHLRLWAESPAAIRCFSSSASPYRTIGCRVPTSALLSSAPPSVSFGAVFGTSE